MHADRMHCPLACMIVGEITAKLFEQLTQEARHCRELLTTIRFIGHVLMFCNPVAIEDGMRFAIREGGRTVGAGVVSKIIK